MNGRPEVSVIVLSYKQADTVGRAIDSVLAQRTSFPFEIVLCDDHSPDGTGEVCRRYAAEHPDVIRLVERPVNVGVVANYFDCMSRARGRFIADCAGDDYWLGTDSLQRLYNELQAHPEAVLAHADWQEVDASTGAVTLAFDSAPRYREDVTDGRQLLERLLAHVRPFPVHLSAALYRLDILREAMAENPELVHNEAFGCEDLPLLAALLSRGPAVYVPHATLAYTVAHDSVSRPADLEKAFWFYHRTAVCTHTLAEAYGVESAAVKSYLRERVDILFAVAMRLRSSSLWKAAAAVSRLTGEPGSWKSRVRRLLKPFVIKR